MMKRILFALLGLVVLAAPARAQLFNGSPVADTNGYTSPFHVLSAASTNATVIKAGAGQLYHFEAVNTTATTYYLKFYNSSTSPACNSANVVLSYPIPSTSGGSRVEGVFPLGVYFSSGISMCITGGIADNDNTNAAAGVAFSAAYR